MGRAWLKQGWKVGLVLALFAFSWWWASGRDPLGVDVPLEIPRILVVETEGMQWAIDTEKLLFEYAPEDTVSLVDSVGTLYWQGTRNELLGTLKGPVYYD